MEPTKTVGFSCPQIEFSSLQTKMCERVESLCLNQFSYEARFQSKMLVVHNFFRLDTRFGFKPLYCSAILSMPQPCLAKIKIQEKKFQPDLGDILVRSILICRDDCGDVKDCGCNSFPQNGGAIILLYCRKYNIYHVSW